MSQGITTTDGKHALLLGAAQGLTLHLYTNDLDVNGPVSRDVFAEPEGAYAPVPLVEWGVVPESDTPTIAHPAMVFAIWQQADQRVIGWFIAKGDVVVRVVALEDPFTFRSAYDTLRIVPALRWGL